MQKVIVILSAAVITVMMFTACDNPETRKPNNESIENSSEDTGPIKEVSIGEQVWMAENLKVAKFRNGESIPHAKTNEAWQKAGNKGQAAWCYYDNDPAKGEKYGKLYNWYAVNDPRGLAPEGWRVPSKEDWTVLKKHLGDEPGTKMKSTAGWKKDGNGTNSSGFSGLPGGLRNPDGSFRNIGGFGGWWCSREGNSSHAWNRILLYLDGDIIRNLNGKEKGMSVRCVRD